MMRYTQEMCQYIREIAGGRLCKEIADMFNERFGTNVTASQIKNFKSNHGIISDRSNIDYKKKVYYNRILTDEQIAYLKSIYKGISNRECTRMMNEKFNLSLSCDQIKAQKARLKLNSGLSGRFEKGYKSDYRFKKGERNSIDTEFKKGNKPHNWCPVGTERVKADGYVYVKVKDERGKKNGHKINWKQKHIILWEEAYGPVPEGLFLIFLDNNKLNVNLDNLACVTLAERLIMCKKHLIYDDPDLTKTGISIAKLLAATYKKQKD